MRTAAGRAMILSPFATALVTDVACSLVFSDKLYHGLYRGFMPPKIAE